MCRAADAVPDLRQCLSEDLRAEVQNVPASACFLSDRVATLR